MIKNLKVLFVCLVGVALAGGCATQLPMPIQLVDSQSKVHKGAILPDTQRIEVTIDGHSFTGDYIVASGEAVSQTVSGRRGFPSETTTAYYSNSARSHLTADNGRQLSCDFLFEIRKAIGECRTPSGVIYQLNSVESPSMTK